MSTLLTIGVVGAGAIARTMHLPVLANMPDVEVAWITDRDEARGAALARAFGLSFARLGHEPRELPPSDVVLLAIPLQPREAYYVQLAERGTAVFAEKPFAICAADHARFLSLYPSERIGCSYLRRGAANHRLLRRAVAERWFGRLHGLNVAEGARSTRTGVDSSYQDLDVESGGGILANLGCHALDAAFFVTGSERYTLHSRDVLYDGRTDREAHARFTLHDAAGRAGEDVDVDYTVSWLDRRSNTLVCRFEHVTVATSVAPAAEVWITPQTSGARPVRLETSCGGGTATQAYYLVWREFLEGVRRGHAGMTSAAQSFLTARLIDELRAPPAEASCAS